MLLIGWLNIKLGLEGKVSTMEGTLFLMYWL
jgi:hypothetical protein